VNKFNRKLLIENSSYSDGICHICNRNVYNEYFELYNCVICEQNYCDSCKNDYKFNVFCAVDFDCCKDCADSQEEICS
jgi:hypothetical protein